MINISEKISSLRKAHNLTQEALGEAVGVSAQAVSKWEKGDSLPDISVIPDICRTFGISADTLIGNEGNMTSKMYMEKAVELCGNMVEKINLIHEFMAKINNVNEEYQGQNLNFYLSDNEFLLADGRGFGMYFNNMELIKNIMEIDITKSELLKFISDEKALKMFSLIYLNGKLSDDELIKLTGFSEQEVTERILKFMKYSIVSYGQHIKYGDYPNGQIYEGAYSIMPNGILLVGIMANAALFEPEGRKGIKGTSISCNHNH
jgi:transcriptional regulator with XRE-family HTH domain